MARAKSKNRGGNPGASMSFLAYQGMVLRIVVAAAVLGVVIFFRGLLGNIIFETIGFGLILCLAWVGVVALLLLWRPRWRILFTRWNIWLGLLSLTIAIWAILSLFHPSGLTIADAKFSEVSLGGRAGEYLVGNQGDAVPPSLRLTLFILAGIVLVAPKISFRFLQLSGWAARAAVLAMRPRASRLLAGLGHRLAQLYRRYPPRRLLMGSIVALSHALRRRLAVKSEIDREPLGSWGALGL